MTEMSPIKFDRKGRKGLHEWEKIPASTLDAGDPVQSGETLEAIGLTVRRPDSDAALDPVGEKDTSRYVGGVPKQTIWTFFEDATRQMRVGIWTTTEMHTKPLPFLRNELMHILQGEVTIADATGTAHDFHASDTFLVPKGAIYQWDSTRR